MIRSLAMFAAAAAAAPAAVDVLPLVHGTYVDAGTPCADPPFAALRTYDGRGFGSAHSRDCRARVGYRHGRHAVLANDCIGAGAGPAARDVERLDIRMLSRTRMVLNGSRFRLCRSASLPLALQMRAVTGR